jgi:hypothetical protein
VKQNGQEYRKDIGFTSNGEMSVEKSGYILPHGHLVWLHERPPADRRDLVYWQMYEHFVYYYKELVEKYNCKTIVELSTGAWLDFVWAK